MACSATPGTAAGRRGTTSAADQRVTAAREQGVAVSTTEIAELEAELEAEVAAHHRRWATMANTITTMRVGLEKTDVKVTQICLAWIPVAVASDLPRATSVPTERLELSLTAT